MGNHDSVVQDRLQNGPKNATYTSPEVQKELLHIMGTMIRNIVCSNVKEAGVFSLLADESKDRSKNEQLAIVLRYVDICIYVCRSKQSRWACRYSAVNAICRTYDSLLSTLEEIGDGPDRDKAVVATSLYLQVRSFILSRTGFGTTIITLVFVLHYY